MSPMTKFRKLTVGVLSVQQMVVFDSDLKQTFKIQLNLFYRSTGFVLTGLTGPDLLENTEQMAQ
jgi:hypothetical protein